MNLLLISFYNQRLLKSLKTAYLAWPSYFTVICLQYIKNLVHTRSQHLSLSCIWLFATPWTAAHQASLSIPISWSLLKLMSIELVMPSNHLILCHLLLLLPSIFSSIRVLRDIKDMVCHFLKMEWGLAGKTQVFQIFIEYFFYCCGWKFCSVCTWVIFLKAYSENSKFYFRAVNLRTCVRGAEKGKGLMAKTVRRHPNSLDVSWKALEWGWWQMKWKIKNENEELRSWDCLVVSIEEEKNFFNNL